MRLDALVSGKTPLIGSDTTLAEAAEQMMELGVDGFAVCDGPSLVGIITERDVVAAVAAGTDLEASSVKGWMTQAPDTVSSDTQVGDAVKWMLEMNYRHLPVVDGGELVGVVGVRDLLFALSE